MMDTEQTVVESLMKEHEVVEEIIWQLDRLVGEGGLFESGSAWCRRVCNELSAFRDHLERHFQLEEESGYLLDVVALIPQASEAVERLRREHDEILGEASEILKRGDSLDSEVSPAVVEFGCQVRGLISTIRRHEAEETVLIERTYIQPGGSEMSMGGEA